VLALLALAGCAAHRPLPPPEPRPAPGYDARIDSLDAVDPIHLRGRRIAIDPGHGGWFRGSLGVHGLAEADVNLGVALYLEELLEARGAIVFMTRSTSQDFLSPADSTLRADLAERMRLANRFEPELFVSIHHNADAGSRHDVNETQTYYRLGDTGASLDAAESVHRFLVRNLGIRAHRILPGNYSVLRNSNAPAILTESSYLTNPDVEARLALPEKQRLEAEALYLGIAHYFARGAPVIESFGANWTPDEYQEMRKSLTTQTVWQVFQVAAPVLEARVAGAFDWAELRLDGTPVPLERHDGRLIGRPRGVLANGIHEAVLDVRLAGAAAARPARFTFEIDRHLAEVRAEPWPAFAPPAGRPLGVRFSLLDDLGAAVPDSIPLLITRAGALDTTVIARDGIAWLYLPDARPGTLAFDVRARQWPTYELQEPRRASATLAADPGPGTAWTGFLALRDSTGSRPLTAAPGTADPQRRVTWLNRDGFAVLTTDSTGAPLALRLAGYRRAASSDGIDAAPAYVAIAAGVLHGRRIVLDPDGGGDGSGGVGPSGTRAAHVNLRVARILRGFLEAAGAEVRLTRDGDDALSDIERVKISESFGAERYLRIGHRAEPARLGHFFSSSGGKAWARRTAATLERFGIAKPAVGDDAQYPLQQTSCPALYVSAARIDQAAAEDALLAPGALRAEAYALYVAILREWATDAPFAIDSLFVRDADGRPVAGAAVTLGDALMLESDAAGRVRFARTEPGPMEASVADSRVTTRMILLDSTQGAILTGPRGR
jgi:N-acetylmuramoyl-L-alanine amidase